MGYSEPRTFLVTGMTCAHCAASVQEEVGELDGITAATADLASGVLTVTGSAPDSAITAAVAEAGYAIAP